MRPLGLMLAVLGFCSTSAWGQSLTWVTPPANGLAGHLLSSVVVHAQDAGGKSVSGLPLTLSIKSGTGTAGAGLGDIVSASTNSAGNATFSRLAIDRAGAGYVMSAAANGYPPLDSPPFSLASAPLSLLCQPMAHSIAVSFNINEAGGAEPSSAVLQWSPAGKNQWKRAQPFVRIRSDFRTHPTWPTDPRMAVSVFGLEENTAYDIQVTFTGANYPATLKSTATTLRTMPPEPSGDTVAITVDPSWTALQMGNAVSQAMSRSPIIARN